MKSFILYGLTSAISKSISLILIPLYVRFFSTSDYGIIDLIQTIIMISMTLSLMKLETSMQRYYYTLKNDLRKKMISTVFISVFCLSLIVSIVVFISSPLLSRIVGGTERYTNVIQLASTIVPFFTVSILNFIILRYKELLGIFLITTVLQTLTTAGVTLYLLFMTKIGVASVFWGQLVGYALVAVVQLIILRKDLYIYWNMKILKRMLAFSLPLLPATACSSSLSYFNRVIMLAYLTTASIGIFSVALKFAAILDLFNYAFIMTWTPFVYRTLKSKNPKEVYRRNFDTIVPVIAWVILCFALFSNEIIMLFTVPSYYKASILLPGLFMYNGIYLLITLVDLGPSITKNMIYTTYAYIIATLANIIALYLGVKLLHELGVVFAMILTQLVLLFFAYKFSQQLYPIHYDLKKHSFILLGTFSIILVLMLSNLPLLIRIMIWLSVTSFVLFSNKYKTIEFIKQRIGNT